MPQDSIWHFGMKIFECKQGLNIHLSSTRSGIGKIWPKFPLLALAVGMHRVTSVTLGDHTGILWWLAGQGSRAWTGSETWKCQRSVFLSGQSLEIDMWVNEACTRTYCTYYYRVRKPSRAHWIAACSGQFVSLLVCEKGRLISLCKKKYYSN